MYLIFDIGGTFIRCAGVSNGCILRKEKVLTSKIFSDGMNQCVQLAERVLEKEQLEFVVVGCAGTLDRGKQIIYQIPQLPGWNNGTIASSLRNFFQCDVIVHNDAELAGLGESVYGAGRGKKIVAYMTVSTGVGGARIINGQIDANTWGFEPGHQLINVEGETKRLLDSVSGRAIEAEMGIKPEDISDEYFWEKKSKILAIGISNTILFWSPEIVILGGSVSQRISLEIVKKQVERYVGIFSGVPEIVRVGLGDDSGLLGGIALSSQMNRSVMDLVGEAPS